MSTYENPLTVIDRESGKIWTNAINTLSEQALRKREKKEAEQNSEQKRMQQLFAQEANYVLNNQEEFAKSANSNGINNPSLFKAGQDLINDMAKAATNVKTAKTQESQQAALNESSKLQKLYTDLIKIVKTGGDADKTYVSDRVDLGVQGWKAPGDQGGMSITGEETNKFINRMNVRTGAGMGATEKYARKADNSGWDLQYTGGRFGNSITTVDALKSLSYDPGLVPDLKKQVDNIFKTDSGQGEDGKTFAILQKNGEYSKEYLDMENTVFEDGSVDEDGSFRRTEIAPANSALIASTSTAKLNNLVNNYLASPNKANKVFMEVLPNNEKPLERSLDGSITPKDAEIFRKQVLEYGRKQLPNYNVIGQETVIDYKKRLGSRIKEAEKTEGTKKDKAQAVKEVAKELVADLVEDPEAFLTRHMQKEDFDMTQGPGAKGFSVIEVDNKGNESRYTYDLTNPSDIERFFRLEVDLGTKADETKILNEINKIAGVSKANTQTSELSAKDLLTKYSN
tara:strand:+ start:1482 stop:3017 length:1536 start_codon:yes stop_codon:yes gene_type:complete